MEFTDIEEGMPPMEDSIQAFVSTLVGPMLNEYQRYAEPSDAAQQQVAKQMQAVVLLYNYYHRKNYPHLEFLNCLNFCRFAVVSCAKLIAYMGVMKGSSQSLSSLPRHRVTPTERMVKEACETCTVLDSRRTMSDIKAWPTSKVAVLIVDAMKERCILIYGSITKGVWSLVEKEVDGFDNLPGGSCESDKKNWLKQKEKGANKRAVGSILNAGDNEGVMDKFLQLAFSAVKEQTGIDEHSLEVMSKTLVYSLTKTKTSCLLYMMRYVKETHEFATHREVKWVPLNEALNSVEGPLIEIVSPGNYGAAATVSYFHLRPYYNAIHDWWSRKDSAQTLENVQCAEGPISMALDHQDNPTHSTTVKNNKQVSTTPKFSATIGDLGNMKADFPEDPFDSMREVKSGSQLIAPGMNPARDSTKCTLRSTEKPLIPVKDKASMAERVIVTTKERGDKRKSMQQSFGNHAISMQNNSISTEQVSSPSNGQGVNRKGLESREGKSMGKLVEEVNNSVGMKSRGQETHVPPYTESDGGMPQNYKSNGVHGVSFEQNDVTHKIVLHDNFSNGLGEHAISKDMDVLKVGFQEISKKRDGLLEDLTTCQLHYQARAKELLREIAECDAKINTILRGDKDGMVLVNDRTLAAGKVKRAPDIGVPINDTKKRKLSEGLASLRNSFQELNEICIKNQWSPSYTVINSSDAKELSFATVTVRGVDFERSERGELKSREMEAKESAASYMLSTLYRMSGQ